MTTPRTLRAGMKLSQADVEAINLDLLTLNCAAEKAEIERDSARRELENTKFSLEQTIEVLKLELEQLKKDKERLAHLLKELHAIVLGECPSLLNEDSDGYAELDLKIRESIDAAMRKETKNE